MNVQLYIFYKERMICLLLNIFLWYFVNGYLISRNSHLSGFFFSVFLHIPWLLCMRVFQQLFATSLPHIKLFSFGQLVGTIVRD